MTTTAQIRDLVTFALRELRRMRLGDGTYCVEIHADDMRPRGRSIRYSVMVALGLLRARAAGYEVGVDLQHLIRLLLANSHDASLTPGDLGLLLWLDRRARSDRAPDLLMALDRRLQSGDGLKSMQGMEVAWIGIGADECVRSGINTRAEPLLRSVRNQLCWHNRASSGLLLHKGIGRRRRFPNFATQIYGTLALSRIGQRGDEEALTVARGVADGIVALQRADGGWPWIFDASRRRVVEPYEIYAVHQDAMAPMGLFELYAATGDERYRAAAARGIEWIYGRNDLHTPMLDAHRGIVYRSIRRRSPWDRAILYANTASAYAGLATVARRRGYLEINPTDRPYHLGWILEAWCGREQLVLPAAG